MIDKRTTLKVSERTAQKLQELLRRYSDEFENMDELLFRMIDAFEERRECPRGRAR